MSRNPELNGNGPPSFLGKRKKVRSKKLATKSHLHNWVDSTGEQLYDPYNGVTTHATYNPYWPPIIPNQRLYPAVSDPSVCNYPPMGAGRIPPMGGYRVEPTMSLPVYPMQCHQQPTPANIANYVRMKPSGGPPKAATSTDSVYSSSGKNNDSLQQEFTSLPPVIDRLILDDSDSTKRRFSDPGIGVMIGESESGGSSGRSSVLTVDNKDNSLIYSLIEQVNALKESNRKLFRELHETKCELNGLKQQMSAAAWSKRERDYEPGTLAEIIREIRDAAKVREDALITKVRHMIEEKSFSRSYFTPSFNSSREIDELRNQLKDALTDNNRKTDRVIKLEEEIRNLKLNSTRTLADPASLDSELLSDVVQGTTQVLELEQETLQLRRELQEAVDGRKEAEARNMKYERQFQLQQRHRRSSSNEANINNNNANSTSTNPFESNSSLISVVDNDVANKVEESAPLVEQKQHQHQQQQQQQHTALSSAMSNVTYERTSPLHVTLSGPVTDL